MTAILRALRTTRLAGRHGLRSYAGSALLLAATGAATTAALLPVATLSGALAPTAPPRPTWPAP
jgi:hypothetical protein